MTKAELSAQIRAKKRAMTGDEIRSKSRMLCAMFLCSPEYLRSDTVYAYLPYNQEVRTEYILEKALADGKKVAVPKVFGDTMKFIYLEDLDQVSSGYCGIPEPVADGPVADDPTALVLMPGLAFDEAGHRIGYGGGFYDKFLASEPNHPTVALCYDFQMVEDIPVDERDIPVDRVIHS